MKINEIADLVSIRNYVANSINNFSIKKESVSELNKTLLVLDRMLVDELTGESFKSKIDYHQGIDEALQQVRETSLKKPTEKIVTIEEGKAVIK